MAANVLMLAMVLGGYFASGDIQRSLLPDTSVAQIQVSIAMPGASAAAIERDVLLPIERALLEMPEFDAVRATAKPGVGLIMGMPRLGVDTAPLMDAVKQRVARVRHSLPDNAQAPIIEPMTVPKVAAYVVVVAPKADGRALRDLADSVRRDLSRHVPKVESVLMPD